MKYFLYFVAFLILDVIFAVIGINLPDWLEIFIVIWFCAYGAVYLYGLMRGSDDGTSGYTLTNEQALFRAFIISVGFSILSLFPMELAIIIVLVIVLLIIIAIARRL